MYKRQAFTSSCSAHSSSSRSARREARRGVPSDDALRTPSRRRRIPGRQRGHDEPARPAGRRQPSPTGCGSLARIRACARRAQLDAALAQGADPWSSGPLMVRAERLGSLTERRNIAAGLRSLVEFAEYQRSGSRYLVVRHRQMLEERETLVALADRLDHPQPVEVAVVAQLRALVSDSASPVYEGGADPAESPRSPPTASSGLHRRRRELRQPKTEPGRAGPSRIVQYGGRSSMYSRD